MRITVFTSNQPRHMALIEALVAVADEVYAVQECLTIFPGRAQDLYRGSAVMTEYFRRVAEAEEAVFGGPRFLPAGAALMPIRMGDLNMISLDTLAPALRSDAYVVFGAGYIKGTLCDHLIDKRACNIHMGIAPYYRGSSTNFWAMYDGRPDLVGATLHLLTHGLDSGPILRHALPPAEADEPFVAGMKAVKAAHEALVDELVHGGLKAALAVDQAKGLEIRYSRYADFSDEAAREYLDRLPSPEQMEAALRARDMTLFVRPYVGGSSVVRPRGVAPCVLPEARTAPLREGSLQSPRRPGAGVS